VTFSSRLATLKLILGKNNFYLKLEALSLKTGKTLWDTIPAFTKGTHSGVAEGEIGALISSDSRAIYAVVGVDIYAYNASNGQLLWHIVSHVTGEISPVAGITGLAVG
jgi:outer membrane protein assembly factor BamB